MPSTRLARAIMIYSQDFKSWFLGNHCRNYVVIDTITIEIEFNVQSRNPDTCLGLYEQFTLMLTAYVTLTHIFHCEFGAPFPPNLEQDRIGNASEEVLNHIRISSLRIYALHSCPLT